MTIKQAVLLVFLHAALIRMPAEKPVSRAVNAALYLIVIVVIVYFLLGRGVS